MGPSTLFRYAAGSAALALVGATGWQLRLAAREQPSLTEQPPRAAVEAAPSTEAAPAVQEVATLAALPPLTAPAGSSGEVGAAIDSAPKDPGAYRSPEVIVDGVPRVYPLTRNVWVRPRPSSAGSWLGFLWFGSSVRVRDSEPRPGPGCRGRWYGVEPRGYVCVDDDRATLDPEHPGVRGLARYAPNLASAWPHRYGESIDLQRYVELPSERLQRAREWNYRDHEALVARARAGEAIESLLGVDLRPSSGAELSFPVLPKTLQMDRGRLGVRSTVAWSREQTHGQRSFLLSSDLKWVAKDRVKVYPTVTFRGVQLGREAKLPLAFFRGRDRASFVLGAEGQMQPGERVFQRLTWVELSGRSESFGTETYLETREPNVFVRQSDAVVPKLAEVTPWRTPLAAMDDPRAPSRGRATWIEASITGGWLLAYEGRTPVFATLIAAGRGGAPHGERDPIETASTPVGRFKITGKFATATMVAPNDLVHSDVPWAQNFSGPHALHSAYWHDGWGGLESGGCVNVSPLDGRWLFNEFTEPRLPEGWHGVRWLPELEPATTLILRK